MKAQNLKNLFLSVSPIMAVMVLGLSLAFADSKHPVKYLSLSEGVIHDEELPRMPSGQKPRLKGKFRDLVKASYSARSKVLRIEPKKVGIGTIVVTHPTTGQVIYEFRIDVKTTDLFKVGREVKQLLKEIEGISIKVANNKIIIDGQVLLPKDIGRIHNVSKQYGDLVVSLVTLSPVAQVKIAKFIERNIGNPEIHVRAVNNSFILEGVANSEDEKKKAEIIAKIYVPDIVNEEYEAEKKVQRLERLKVINLITVKPPPEKEPNKIIQIVVHYVELKKDYAKSFRFQWTPEIGDGTEVSFTNQGAGGVVSQITGTISNLLPKLNWAKSHGHARILQSSSLIIEDGKKGVLNSIQRIPYKTVNANGNAATNFEEAGIRAVITPQIQGARSDSVALSLNFGVKAFMGTTESGPLTNSREISTSVVVRSGMSAAVGGLISNESSTGYNRLPASAPKNPLFSLYASKDFQRNQSQFVVFVTPIIKSSASAGAEKIKRKFRLRN